MLHQPNRVELDGVKVRVVTSYHAAAVDTTPVKHCPGRRAPNTAIPPGITGERDQLTSVSTSSPPSQNQTLLQVHRIEYVPSCTLGVC